MKNGFKFQSKPIVRAVVALGAAMVASSAVQAGAGFGDAYDVNNVPFIIQSYFATSPSGARLWVDPAGVAAPFTGAPGGYDPANQAAYSAAVSKLFPSGYTGSGKALRKFVDTLPLPAGHALTTKFTANKTTLTDDTAATKYIPVAVPTKWVNPQGVTTTDDYYEIAAIEYSEKFHSDLKKATTLRGFVQIDQGASNGRAALPGSKSYALTYPDGTPILIAGTDANGKLTGFKVPALAVDAPHFLGPLLTASQGIPTRVKFHNLLPVGRAETTTKTIDELVFNPATAGTSWTTKTVATVKLDANNVPLRHGDLFLPLDPSVPGAGLGPDGLHTYSQNRVNMHLHGGDNPWISDGGPHTWITPAGEADATVAGSIAYAAAPGAVTASMGEPAAGALDPTLVPGFLRGSGAINVPDMYDPGPGAMTYYFPNGQSARMEWYHDHTVGITRLNVYAGLVSAYFLTDAKEQDLITRKVIPGPDDTIPLILQDKTFVPDDIALQDARWDTAAWGAPGDQWYPHVYETVQDPNQATSFNSVGRWHWGPWFWPSYPSAYALPSGSYGDVTLTPEAWQDTPVVNGVAYPTLTVEPKTYRLRVLNGSNDRTFSLNLFVADSSVTAPVLDANGAPTGAVMANTEMKMVPVNSWVGNGTACADPAATRSYPDPVTGVMCTPATWTTDVYGHNGGVPDAGTQGPTWYQIGNEGGFLPGVAIKEPQPLSFLLDKGRAAVLNVDFGASGLLIGNGERADLVVDFSQYAGKTLLVYNDNGAPVPAADPRNEFFTGYGDNSATGGAEDTRPGYGPNSRTMMQIVVSPAMADGTLPAVKTAADIAAAATALDTEIKLAYKAVQEPPVVAQSAYNGALGTAWTDTQSFASIFVGSLKQPTFDFVPGTAGAVFNSVKVTSEGSGYVRPPSVTVTPAPAGGVSATAVASLKIDKLHVINGGAGYKVTPTVTITSTNKGSGADATAQLKVGNVQVTSGGSGYTAGGVVQAVALTTPGSYLVNGVNGVTIANGGVYTANQVRNGVTVTFSAPPAGGTRATGTVVMSAARTVQSVTITNPGSGYTTAPTATFSRGTTTAVAGTVTLGTTAVAPTVTFAAPAGGTAATATAQVDAITGQVTGITLTSGGSGYATAPTPTFVGAAGTTAATATTTVSAMPKATFAKPLLLDGAGLPGRQAAGVVNVNALGVVTGVTITDAGSGYGVAPSVTIDPPYAGAPASAIAKATSFGSVGELILTVHDPVSKSSGGGGYDDLSTTASEPANTTPGLTITMTAPPAVPAAAGFTAATATAGATGRVFDITFNNSGKGYTANPTITVAAPAALPAGSPLLTSAPAAVLAKASATTDTFNGGTPQGKILVKTKAIQELFDPTYGRLNATFGVEIPYTSALTQTTIPLGYVDTPTEEFQDGETQIWKITHNGVDTHPIHFHLVNVQLINRVGWDNFVTPPEPNELGWKETIKMSPLEDVIVAVRAKKPKLGGFGIPNSYRLLDPSQPEGAMTGFTQIDPNTGLPATVANTWQDFGWEYVWHCHILGHEENDFMRPIMFQANEVLPATPTAFTARRNGTTGVDMSWADNSVTEFAYQVQYTTSLTPPGATTAWNHLQDLLANTTAYSVTAEPAGATYYRVAATGQAGTSVSAASTVLTAPNAPTLAVTPVTAVTRSGVTVSWVDASTNESGFVVQYGVPVNGVVTTWTSSAVQSYAAATTAATGAAHSLAITGLLPETTYVFRVVAVNAAFPAATAVASSISTEVTATTLLGIPATPTMTRSLATGAVTVNFVDGSTIAASYTVQRATNAGFTAGLTNFTGIAGNAAGTGPVSYVDTTAVAATPYYYRVVAVNGADTATSLGVTAAAVANPGTPGVPTSVISAGQIALSWTAVANAASYTVQRATVAANGTVGAYAALAAGTGVVGTTFADTTVVRGTRYRYRLVAVNARASSGNGQATGNLTAQ